MQWKPDRKKAGRRYRYKSSGQLPWGKIVLVFALTGMIIFCLVKLIGYGSALIASRKTNEQLRTLYYSPLPETEPPQAVLAEQQPTETPAPAFTAAVGTAAVPAVAAATVPGSAAPTDAGPTPVLLASTYSPTQKLKAVTYPTNPKATPSLRFQTLRLECPDAVGWLTIKGMLDETVVQRDNIFYLDHDPKGKTNANGALFLDAAVSMKTRPYTLLIYGHNMRSGAMFGSLRRYENVAYYRENPMITFDSMYESGRYVVFATGIIGMTANYDHYIDFFAFTSTNAGERQQMIESLINASPFTNEVSVSPEDQLLVLVTCVDNDDQRRIVAARRVRDGETESQLMQQISQSRAK